ncbi:T9SS type A sorting domain-containing protein [Rubrivirga sp.]|uniref:T9SS type A sorting domain-containing protein n=1 Tax=Rubrivirga sp. TaxID=1885344 RepID=UPI003B529D2B
MRVVSLPALFVLLASVAVSAQTGDPIPDPTPAHLYFPLAVGDVREYEDCVEVFNGYCFRHEQLRREIDRDSLIGEVQYFVEKTWDLDDEGYWTDLRETRLLRFDTTSAVGVARLADGTEERVTCQLDAPFNSSYSEDGLCSGAVEDLQNNQKHFGVSDGGRVYEAGVGLVRRYGGAFGIELTYWRVGAVEGGTPYPVSTDRASEARGLRVSALPNPTAGPLALSVDVPAPATVTLEAFDALGRRVWQSEVALGAGRQQVEVDVARWAPGLYVVRARTERGSATATVVRR